MTEEEQRFGPLVGVRALVVHRNRSIGWVVGGRIDSFADSSARSRALGIFEHFAAQNPRYTTEDINIDIKASQHEESIAAEYRADLLVVLYEPVYTLRPVGAILINDRGRVTVTLYTTDRTAEFIYGFLRLQWPPVVSEENPSRLGIGDGIVRAGLHEAPAAEGSTSPGAGTLAPK